MILTPRGVPMATCISLISLPFLVHCFVQPQRPQFTSRLLPGTNIASNTRAVIASSVQFVQQQPNHEEEESGHNDDYTRPGEGRRSFLGLLAAVGAAPLLTLAPENSFAGIDVSGLRTDGRGGSGNSAISSQLRAYDGSATSRIQDIKSMTSKSGSAASTTTSAAPGGAATASTTESASGATWALTTSPRLSKLGLAGERYRFQDQLVNPAGGKPRSVSVSFDFPSDWLQLDRAFGGVQYVDQRNGDKLYLLRAQLPADTTDLSALPKQWFGNVLFDPTGSIVRSGTNVEDYKVSSIAANTCPKGMCASSRRLMIKYATVTGNGLRVERRGLVQAVQAGSDVYMIMTSSNAVKFEKKGIERDTVEAIVDSFRLENM